MTVTYVQSDSEQREVFPVGDSHNEGQWKQLHDSLEAGSYTNRVPV